MKMTNAQAALLVAAGLLGAAQGQTEDLAWALGQMRGTHTGFGSCIDNSKGQLAAFTKEDCPERDQTTTIQVSGRNVRARFVTRWYDAYPTLTRLENDIASVGAVRLHWVALKPGVSLIVLFQNLQDGMRLQDWLVASDSTWASVSTPSATQSSAVLAALSSHVRFVLPQTTAMTMEPMLTLPGMFEADLSDSAAFVVDLVEDADAETMAKTWASASVDGRSGPSTVAFDAKMGRITANSMAEAQFLAAQPEVAWVSLAPRFETSNEDAAAVLQSGYEGAAEEWQTSLADKMSVWNRGIKGQGQFVGVGDSGLQVSHCMFQDDVAQDMANMRRRRDGEARIKYDYAGHRKVVQYVAWADGIEGVNQGHGTHVAGTVAGSPKSSNVQGVLRGPSGAILVDAVSQQGVAPEAKLAFFDLGSATQGNLDVPKYLATIVGHSKDVGAFLHTNSWGDSRGRYEALTRSADTYLFDNQDFAVLFSAGNSGGGHVNIQGTRMADGGNTIGAPAVAKNVITVGASQNTDRSYKETAQVDERASCFKDSTSAQCADSLAYFSSKGPTGDGRLKPDVVAPGLFIISSRSISSEADTCDFYNNAGTSMSTPAMAGAAALVRQWYTDGYFVAGVEDKANGIKPMGALIKASLVHSAETLGGFSVDTRTGTSRKIPLDGKPDVQEGFGRPMLENLMGSSADDYTPPFIVGDFDDMVFLEDGETYTRKLTVSNAEQLLRATLVWYDAPASVFSVRQLINDLDLTITAPSGKVYLGNGEATPDRLNTVEQIDVPPAELEVGEYTLTISAKVPVARQPFALLVSGASSVDDGSPVTAAPTTSPVADPSTKAPTGSPIAKTKAPTGSPIAKTMEPTASPITDSESKAPTGSPIAQTTAPTGSPIPNSETTTAPTGSPIAGSEPTTAPTTAPTSSPVAGSVTTTSAPTTSSITDSETTTAPSSTAPTSEQAEEDGLSTNAIVGIIAGASFLVLTIAGVAAFTMRRNADKERVPDAAYETKVANPRYAV